MAAAAVQEIQNDVLALQIVATRIAPRGDLRDAETRLDRAEARLDRAEARLDRAEARLHRAIVEFVMAGWLITRGPAQLSEGHWVISQPAIRA